MQLTNYKTQVRGIKTLTLNAGSTTLKYSLYDVTRRSGAASTAVSANGLSAELIASGLVDRVGMEEGGSITHNKQLMVQHEEIPSHTAGLTKVIDILKEEDHISFQDIDCIGHRVVHGGATFSAPALITNDVKEEIRRLSVLAPLHNPPAVDGIDASLRLFPNATQVAIFDTAFHATIPPSAYRYAIPNELYEKYGIRRYGFHGTSYKYVVEEAAKYLGKEVQDCNMIVLHLGGGASMCCIQNGQSIDTTMGLTPLEGLVMATRSGDIDAGVYDFLLSHGYTLEDVNHILNKESGLRGLAGTSDMRRVKKKALKGDAASLLARDVFVERCRKYLGSYLLKLKGEVDAIVFTGGIGEKDSHIREAICTGLDKLQISLDTAKNNNAVGATDVILEIQKAFYGTKLLVVPTNEELSIAMQSSEFALPVVEEAVAVPAPPQASKPSSNLCMHSIGDSYTAAEELGLLSYFAGTVEHVGYFRPIRCEGAAYRMKLMKGQFGLSEDLESMYGVNQDEAWKLLADGHEDDLYERILEKYMAYCADKDFVLVSTKTEGADSLHLNAKLCSALDVPAIIVGAAEYEAQFGIAQSVFARHGTNCLGAIMSHSENIEESKQKLEALDLKPIAVLPRDDILDKRTVSEVMNILEKSVCLFGEEHLQNPIDKIKVYSMNVDDMLPIVEENELAVFYGNRVDSLMSLLLSAQSSNAPSIAGVVLTLNELGTMDPKVMSILNGVEDIRFPVISTPEFTFEAAYELKHAPHFMTSDSHKKIVAAQTLMATHLDYSFLEDFASEDFSRSSEVIGPRLFQYSTFLKAREVQKTIVLPEGADPRVVEAASILSDRKLCKVLLVGDPEVINANAQKTRVSLDGVTIVNPRTYERLDEMVDAFVEARKKKGLKPDDAREILLSDVNYFGTLIMHLGVADGMVSGAMHSSANTIRPALQVLKTAPDASIVSSIFFMLLEDGVKVFGDCAINVDPNADQLSEIAVSSAKTAREFGISPRVALLSYATGDSNKGDLVDKVIEATETAKDVALKQGFMDPNLIEGPLQFDAAVDPAVANVKMKGSPVAGHANVLIFPDLNSGNNGYKAVQQATKTVAVGPILQGLKKPVNDLSRGATIEDIVNTAVLTALQASHNDH